MAVNSQPLVRGKDTATVSNPEPNAFIGQAAEPTDADLARVLGSTKQVWDELIAHLASQHEITDRVWRSYSPKAGWALRLLRKKRTIVWMAPLAGSFQVTFILGDRAMAAARECGLSAKALRILDEAPKYPEGTGIRLQIKSAKDLGTVKKLTVVKLEN